MSGRSAIWAEASRLATAGTPFAFVTVVRQRGSLPMARDAKMIVLEAGYHAGTVGGGSLEAEAIVEARTAIARGESSVIKHSLNKNVAGDLGLSCGGTVDLFVEPVAPDQAVASLFHTIAAGIDRRARVAVITPFELSGESWKAAWLDDRVAGSGSTGIPPREEIWLAPGTHTYIDNERGVVVERIPRVSRLIIFGAGHVGREICSLAARTGFYVVVTDDREEFANTASLPDAHEVLVGTYDEVLGQLTLDADDYLLSATRGHGMDAAVIAGTAASPARYVGMLGSRRKRAVIWKTLEGQLSAEALDRVASPVGLPIGAKDPAEIAVSVVAELIRVRHEGETAQ